MRFEVVHQARAGRGDRGGGAVVDHLRVVSEVVLVADAIGGDADEAVHAIGRHRTKAWVTDDQDIEIPANRNRLVDLLAHVEGSHVAIDRQHMPDVIENRDRIDVAADMNVRVEIVDEGKGVEVALDVDVPFDVPSDPQTADVTPDIDVGERVLDEVERPDASRHVHTAVGGKVGVDVE